VFRQIPEFILIIQGQQHSRPNKYKNLKNLEALIGNTPLVLLDNINPNPKVKLYAKLEGQNPGGSVKDRAAYYMIKTAIEENRIKEGDTIIEPTSGNTGIALAMIAAI